jgi:hypothetical protein
VHTWQGQCRLTVAVGDAHIREQQIGMDAIPAGGDPPDADRQPDRPAELLLDGWSVGLDVRQYQVAQRQNQQHESEVEQPEGAHHKPPYAARRRMREQRHEKMEAMVERRAQLLLAHQP